MYGRATEATETVIETYDQVQKGELEEVSERGSTKKRVALCYSCARGNKYGAGWGINMGWGGGGGEPFRLPWLLCGRLLTG